MAGTITALQIQKRHKDRVNIFLDEQYALAVPAVAAAALKKGQYLTDAQIAGLKAYNERDKAYNQAIRFLGYRARSRAEVTQHLARKGHPPDLITEIVERLAAQAYLNDEAFVESWLTDRENFKPKGAGALRHELKQKGVSPEVIESALAELDEEELAWSALERKLYQWQSLEQDDLKKKIMGFLSRRGFSYETASLIFKRAQQFLAGE